MTRMIAFTADERLILLSLHDKQWEIYEKRMPGLAFQCIAYDDQSHRLYVGTFDHGLWYSDDFGRSLQPISRGITHPRISALAVSPQPASSASRYKEVWAGTEPSRLYSSVDGGRRWSEYPELVKLPSEPSWSFPPRPYTHHVRYIQPDLKEPSRLFCGIELGGVMRSTDRGQTWEDRKPGSHYDCHTLAMVESAPDRIYEAAGGGFAQSEDGGETWTSDNKGLQPHDYAVNIAVHPHDPETVLIASATGPRQAYQAETAETYIYRKKKNGPWEKVMNGLPDPRQMTVSAIMADADEPGMFFALNNKGLFVTTDSGEQWEKAEVDWPSSYHELRMTGFALI